MTRILTFTLAVAVSLLLSACGASSSQGGFHTGSKPPESVIKVNQKTYETKLATYCWTTGCVDTVGPADMLKDEKPLQVAPGEKVKFAMNYKPQPNEVHVTVYSEGNQQVEVEVQDNTISAPLEKGIYYYSYGVWWKDDKEEHLSHGDAFYYFVLEVI